MQLQERAIEFILEFLNSVETADFEPHDLKTKKKPMITLMRNLIVKYLQACHVSGPSLRVQNMHISTLFG